MSPRRLRWLQTDFFNLSELTSFLQNRGVFTRDSVQYCRSRIIFLVEDRPSPMVQSAMIFFHKQIISFGVFHVGDEVLVDS